MIEVKIAKRPVTEIMDIVRELREQGLVQGTHFDFAYHHKSFDPITGHAVEGRHTIFTFYVDKYATLFSLKYFA